MDHKEIEKAQAQVGSGRTGGPDPWTALLVVNGVIAGIGGSYASTHSIPVTVMAGCGGVLTAALLVWKK